MGVHLSENWGKKCSIFDENFFFGLHLNLGKKVFHLHFFFFWSSLHFQTWTNRGSSPPMLKIGQNWGKIANHLPNAQQRSAPLHPIIAPRPLATRDLVKTWFLAKYVNGEYWKTYFNKTANNNFGRTRNSFTEIQAQMSLFSGTNELIALQQNCYFAHPENLLLAMLGDREMRARP